MERFLKNTVLFRGADEEQISAMLQCLSARRKCYRRGECILRAGGTTEELGLVLRGSVLIVHNDIWGNQSILGRAEQGQIFAETYACVPETPLPVDAEATEDSEILFLNVGSVMDLCSNACLHHSLLVRNLLAVAAQKNLALSQRIRHTSAKSIRGRVLSYLSEQAEQSESSSFTIPFDRQQLADYLNVDRSALSKELSKMQKEGLLTCRKNAFTILKIRELT